MKLFLTSITLLTVFSNIYGQNISSFDIFEKSLQDFILDTKEELSTLERISSAVTGRQLLIGMTQLLKPFRQTLNVIFDRLYGTKADLCITNPKYNLLDARTIPRGIISQVTNLSSVSYSIAEFYSESFASCASAFAKKLQKKADRIPAAQSILTKLVENGSIYIKPCVALPIGSYSPGINQSAACIEQYKTSLLRFRTLFLNAIDGKQVEGEDLSKDSKPQTKNLFSIPNCLLQASNNAVQTANLLLEDIRNCAETLTERFTFKQITIQNRVPHIQTALDYLEQYYANKNNNTLNVFNHYARLALFFNDVVEGDKFLKRAQVVDDIYIETAEYASGLSTRIENEDKKNCVDAATDYLKEAILNSDFALRSCAQSLTSKANSVLTLYANSLQKGKYVINNGEEFATISTCFSENLFSTDGLVKCLNNGYLRTLKVSNEVDLKEYFNGNSVEYLCKEVVYQPVMGLDMMRDCEAM